MRRNTTTEENSNKYLLFVMESGEIKQEVPLIQKLIHFTAWKPQEARGLWPWASWGFQAVKCISFCPGGTSYCSLLKGTLFISHFNIENNLHGEIQCLIV